MLAAAASLAVARAHLARARQRATQ